MGNANRAVIENRLREVPLFKSCTEDDLRSFSSEARVKALKKGNILFIHEDEAQRYYIVISGWVKLFRETTDGDQVVIDIISSGKVFGEVAAFQDGLYPYSAEIAEDAEVISLPISGLMDHLKKDHGFALAMIEQMSQKSHRDKREIEQLSIQSASQRIGCFLLRLADQTKKGEIKLNLPYDKTLIAARLGMQPETFSRALSKLKRNAPVKVSGSKIDIANLKDLANYACIACSSEFPCRDLACNRGDKSECSKYCR